MDVASIYQNVQTRYSEIALQAHGDEAQLSKASRIASSFGYSGEDLASLPSGTNLGVSCGNPLATVNLEPSETMLDLGSGGGLDCLIAANQMLKKNPVPSGKIYGVDRNGMMIALARRNASKSNLPEGFVQFIQAPISEIPLEDSTVDLVVSNCVINLVPDGDKPKVFREIHRLLKAGGRVAISDILAKKPMPDHIRHDAALLVGCVAGASLLDEYRQWMVKAGFQDDAIRFINTEKDLNVYHEAERAPACCAEQKESESCCNKETEGAVCCAEKNGLKPCCTETAEVGKELDFNEWVASYQVYAVK